MAWSDAARAAAAEARKRNRASTQKKYSFRSGPFSHGFRTAEQIRKVGGKEWGTTETHYSQLRGKARTAKMKEMRMEMKRRR